ncbi:putative nuclease HARBI1, partial [Operophtera brumata]
FNTKYGIPGVIGCIDCTHIKIVKPTEEEHLYFCRKNYHSMNVQMICDSNYRVLNVNPKYGGSNHDSFIWENSRINDLMQNLHQRNEIVWLLGDSGYPQRPWLMTPYPNNVAADTPQGCFNQKHIRARVTIENTFGRLKNRWRCLCKDRVLHYKPVKCAQIIQACCVLNNIALDFGVPEPEGD